MLIFLFSSLFGGECVCQREPHLVLLRGYSWLWTQELQLAVLKGPYGMLSIKPRSATYKASTLPSESLASGQRAGQFKSCPKFDVAFIREEGKASWKYFLTFLDPESKSTPQVMNM